MKKLGLLCLITLMTLITSNFALAHGGHFNHFSFGMNLGYPGFYGGYGFYDPLFYPPPFYGIPPVVVPIAPPMIVPSTPPVYIQQHETPATAQPQTHDWYYCTRPEGYYPYVKQCPDGWLRVAPRPSTQ